MKNIKQGAIKSGHSLALLLFGFLILGSVIQQYPLVRDQFYEEVRLALYAGSLVLVILVALKGNFLPSNQLFRHVIIPMFIFFALLIAASIVQGEFEAGV